MAFASDPVAKQVATDLNRLVEHGGSVVSLCGYVMLSPNVDGEPLETMLLYTSKSFDQWLEIPGENVRGQRANLAEYDGRSQIWVDPDAPIKHCRLTLAADAAQTMSSGLDDPTNAYPGKSRP